MTGLLRKQMEGFARCSFLERERERMREWDLSGLKDIFQEFDLPVILPRSEEREEFGGWYNTHSHTHSGNEGDVTAKGTPGGLEM